MRGGGGGGGMREGIFGTLCRQRSIKQEVAAADSPKLNGIAERALELIATVAPEARIQAPMMFPNVQLPAAALLWPKVSSRACNSLNRAAIVSNSGCKSPFERWHGSKQPLLKPGYRKSCEPTYRR